MPHPIELGLDTFGDVTASADGSLVSHAQAIRDVVDQAVLADQLGLDFFGLGEHHRIEFAVSAPEVVLAAIAARTENIRLGSAVTVLSSDDPVRVYQRFASLDALSNGRAEVVLGRGSFTESFPLFGYNLSDYEILFEEKIELFAKLLKDSPVTWSGTTRSSLTNQWIYPRPESGTMTTWVGVGGSPQSVVRAAHYGLPLMLAIIGGEPARFEPYTDLYRRTLSALGKPEQPIAIHSSGFVAETDEEALEIVYPHHMAFMEKAGRERGWPPFSRAQYLQGAGPNGALYIGSPETIARKIVRNLRLLGASRFDMRYSMGLLGHAHLMNSIELYGTQVAPRVRELMQDATP
ncbi:probable oxidoreductase, LLM family [Pseudarthrobacter enclensis]|uniref:Luciferase n=1 Tax=Pseudarthrobacter enclensis TaxID=993070 RepID=A0A0V8I5H4_9MICC|nr:LLM class flavin-dependent oxidoreductase [Pseudarthrobacter enclensis]KSU70024.1 luciferase [Pseudarthrobacter enclensis]SCC30406.1 probable oxidoreductase, LLM family [Pseudarthrobacter enclensis]